MDRQRLVLPLVPLRASPATTLFRHTLTEPKNVVSENWPGVGTNFNGAAIVVYQARQPSRSVADQPASDAGGRSPVGRLLCRKIRLGLLGGLLFGKRLRSFLSCTRARLA